MPSPRPSPPPSAQPRVGVCIDTRDGPARERLLGFYSVALERDWRVYLLRLPQARDRAELERLRLDAAVLYDADRELHETLRAAGVRIVEAGARHLDCDDAAVFMDDQAICRLAWEHLQSLGLNHYAYCGVAWSSVSHERASDLEALSAAAGARFHLWQRDIAEGVAELEPLAAWLAELPKPVGLLAYDDKLAERVLAACRQARVRVPEDVALLGIGDDELLTGLTSPRLSSVALPLRDLGRRCALVLDQLLRGETPAERFQRMQPVEVVVRASTERVVTEDPVVLAALQHIRRHWNHPIGVDQIADAAGAPRRTLERRFAQATGKTVHDHLSELRLRHAQLLLRRSATPLRDLAPRCGYASLSSFIRMFQRATGLHPRVWREHHRDGGA